jgi:DNA gyrase subunit A
MFKLADGERIVRMIGMDPRVLDVPPQEEGAEEPAPPYVVAVSRDGMCLRFSLRGHREPSTRSGRKYMRLADGDETLYVALCEPDAKLACASTRGKALICEQDDVSLLAGAGKGVMLMRLEKGDRLVGAQLLTAPSDSLELEKENGTILTITTRKYNVVSRAGKGFALFQRGSLSRSVPQVPTVPTLPEGGAA